MLSYFKFFLFCFSFCLFVFFCDGLEYVPGINEHFSVLATVSCWLEFLVEWQVKCQKYIMTCITQSMPPYAMPQHRFTFHKPWTRTRPVEITIMC